MIQDKLGFSTIALPGDEAVGARQMAQIRQAGITRVELCGLHPPTHYDYHDRERVSEIRRACENEGVAVVSVHGPEIPYNSPYEILRRAATVEAIEAARVGAELGAKVFVAHFGTNDESAKTITEMLEALDGIDIKLTVENGHNLHRFTEFVDRIGSDRFGMVVDIGHTRDEDGINPFVKKERARETIGVCGDRLFHVHLHDFADRDHYPPFDGHIQWDELVRGLEDIAYGGEFMFEAIAPISVEDTLAKTAAFPAEFSRRYEGTA